MKPQTRNGHHRDSSILVQHSRFALPALLLSAFATVNCTGGRPDVTGMLSAEAEGGASNPGGAGGSKNSSQYTSNNIAAGGSPVISMPGTEPNTAGVGNAPVVPEKEPICGDGVLDPGETCDDGGTKSDSDGNFTFKTKSGDGCSADCKVQEEGYVCAAPGKPCVRSQVCGDKKVTGTENCDDANAVAGDGCSDGCRVEDGWECTFPGVGCIAAQCGDGILAGAETCDDGQATPTSGDGCSATCTIEGPGAAERDAWVCPTAGQPCVRTVCGDAAVEGTEQCDDGNNDTGDGCTPACRLEPTCPAEGGACKSVCGDGMILPDDTDQECDDGNSTAGDGCSASCTVEEGYECKPTNVIPTGKLILPIVYRDFLGRTTTEGDPTAGEHPDFEYVQNVEDSGIVEPKLGANGKPVHVAAVDKETTVNNDEGIDVDWFSIWFRDAVKDFPNPGDEIRYNYTFVNTLTLTETPANSGTFQFTDTTFYPLDNTADGTSVGFGNTTYYDAFRRATVNATHNYHFSSEVRYWFQYSGNETLTFSGDDDVWVFVNKQLTVDLGGVHTVLNGKVQLHESDGTASVCEMLTPREGMDCADPKIVPLGLQIGKVYEIVVFQAERHTTQSNYTLTVSAFKSTRSNCKPVCGDGIVTPDEACDLGADKNTGAYGTCTPDCKLPPYCGDEKIDVEAGEECDDGVNLASYGYNGKAACGPNCKLTHICGDGKVDSLFGEECDDGNHTPKDGCEPNCTTRPGCGNGVLDPGEECDDGNTVSGDNCDEFCRHPIHLV